MDGDRGPSPVRPQVIQHSSHVPSRNYRKVAAHMAFRAFICAPNRSWDPFHVRNEAVGVLLVYDDGNYDCKFKTVEDQGEVLTILDGVNWDNPEVADYIRERMDRPPTCAFWEVEVREGDTVDTIVQRMLDAEKAADEGR